MTDDCESWEAEQARVVSELRETINLEREESHRRLSRISKLEKALVDIMRHQECISGDLAKIGATWRIAERAVRGE